MAASKGQSVSLPISLKEPTDADIVHSEALTRMLDKLNKFEDDEGMQKRKDLLDYIEQLVNKWVSEAAQNQGMEYNSCGARVVAFGGQMLGILMKDSDIDAVCIIPDFVPREEFFTHFVSVLKSESGSQLTQLRLVKGARVPIIEMCLRGYEVDLCVARLKLQHIPEHWDWVNDEVLHGLDQEDIHSLNGTRETSRILDLIPNKKTFLTTLKMVKLWAKAKGIHSTTMGYPGGIAWAIMVARVCQLYPYAAPFTLMDKFFTIFIDWRWPTPVIISPLTRRDVYKLKPWNPKLNHSDIYHVMPVITPAYPEKNCTFSVTRSALHIVTDQLNQASEVMQKISRSESPWEDLIIPINFFSLYKHFLMVTARASSPQDHLDWSGLVQARSRWFVETLEKQESLSYIHAYPKSYTEGCHTKWFWGLQFTDTKGIKLSLASELQQFQQQLVDLAKQRDFYRPGMFLEVIHIRRKDLKAVLPEYEDT